MAKSSARAFLKCTSADDYCGNCNAKGIWTSRNVAFLAGSFRAPAVKPAKTTIQFSPTGRQMGSSICKLATNKYASAFWTDRFVVGMTLRDRKNLSGLVYRSLIVLSDDESSSENEPANRERVSVLSLCRSRLQVLSFYFRVAVGSEFCFKIDLVH
jgi:hypothetical protein